MENVTAYEDLGPTRALTNSARPIAISKPSAEHRRLIAELGLRYRPSAQSDLEAHAAAIALLTCDVSDIPPPYLADAIRAWVREKPYLPRANELIDRAKAAMPKPGQMDWVQRGNDYLAFIGRSDIRWGRDSNGELKLGPVD